jgi:hypothetical protein
MFHLNKASTVIDILKNSVLYSGVGDEITKYRNHGIKQIDLIVRRCFRNETIPHEEKTHSIFEEHTEWIVKGKAGINQELGLRVCIVENSGGFILHHKVMEKMTDDAIALPIIKETQELYPQIRSCSFDKGFYTPDNLEKLNTMLDHCVLPRKGKLSGKNKVREQSKEFIKKRKSHAAVESAINALEHHGLDRCMDHGIKGFKRYVALSILGRNIQLIGVLLLRKEIEAEQKLKKAA